MKIICTQENLKGGLQIVSRIISNSNTLPILNNILLKTENGLLNLSSTNLELGITTTIRCKVEQEGSLCLPAKTITDLINNLPNENITIESKEAEAVVSTQHYNTKIKTLPSDEFPLIPVVENGEKLNFENHILKQALDSVVFAASTSETQPEISGVYMTDSEEGIRFVATDRYRLAEKVVINQSKIKKNIIIPHKTTLELSRILVNASDKTEVTITDNQIAINSGDTQVVSRLIDGQYPDYQQIIPQSFNTTITIAKQDLVNALKTSGIFSRGSGSVVMNFDPNQQQLHVSAISHDVGESNIDLTAEITGDAGSIILNYRYVLEALAVMPVESIVIKVVNEGSPVIFQPQGNSGYIYLVMPIKS